MSDRKRAYFLTHYTRVQITTVVAATSAREAERAWRDQSEDIIDDGWAGEGNPTGRAHARRAPEFDHVIDGNEP